jgi:hypothetical protein
MTTPIEGRYLTGVNASGWHAIAVVHDTAGTGPATGRTACGQAATVAAAYGPFDRDRNLPCPACTWLVAIRGGTLADEVARLIPAAREYAAFTARGIDPLMIANLAEAILAAVQAPNSGYDLDHPRTVQLLTTITRHTPEAAVASDCVDYSCDHDEGQCPVTALWCPTCSLRAESWAGSWEGQYLPECTVSTPCDVLAAIAYHFDIDTACKAAP